MANEEIKNDLDELEDESEDNNMQGDPRFDPTASDILRQQINPKYETTVPTFVPTGNSERREVKSGSDYLRYAYIDGAWRTLLYDGVQKLAEGDGITITGTTTKTISASVDSTEEVYTKADNNIAVDDVVSLLPGGEQTFWLQDLYVLDREIGKQANPNHYAGKFIAPTNIAGFDCTISIKEIGTSTDDVNVVLYTDTAGVPSASATETEVIDDTAITGTYQDLTVTFSSTLTAGTTYWISVEKTGAVDASNHYKVKSADAFTFYSKGATADTTSGTTWTANNDPLVFTLEHSFTAGLYRSLDVPNNISLQSRIKGIVSAVDGDDVTVVTSGVQTDSGTPYTAASNYYLSATTGGGLATTGNCLIGVAQSTSKIDVNSFKRCVINRNGTLDFSGMTNVSFTLMTGIYPARLSCIARSPDFGSISEWSNDITKGLKWNNNTSPAVAELWDTEGSGAGSQGSRVTSLTVNNSSLSLSLTSSAVSSRDFDGTIVIEN